LGGIRDIKGLNQKDLESRDFESRRPSPISVIFPRSIFPLVHPNAAEPICAKRSIRHRMGWKSRNVQKMFL
jgi:hypothetical protein